MTVLDLCAAPGGKSTLIAGDASAMDGRGYLLAVDNSFVRLQRLVHNARLQLSGPHPNSPSLSSGKVIGLEGISMAAESAGASLSSLMPTRVGNMSICRADGRYLRVDKQGEPISDQFYSAAGPSRGTPRADSGGPFDRVLLDAPCSGSGSSISRLLGGGQDIGGDGGDGPEEPLIDRKGHKGNDDDNDGHLSRGEAAWSADGLARNARRQKSLLWNACVLLRPGGTLIYSTCSLSPEENEDVIQVKSASPIIPV